MDKRNVLKSLVLATGLVNGFCILPCFAQGIETITLTTYYPSPYGVYNELEVHRSVTYKPVDKDTLSSLKEGELVYNASDDSLYLYNGSSWVAQGGGGGCYTNYGGNTCASGYTPVLSGFTTFYHTHYATSAAFTDMVCSSSSKCSIVDNNNGIFASSRNGYLTPLLNEPCAICCK